MTLPTAVLAATLLQAVATPGTEIRTLTASILDAKGAPVDDLTPLEVAVVENGVAREVTSVEKDTRPLSLVLLVDNSAEVATAYRMSLVGAIGTFLRRLPKDTTFSLWGLGDRPTKITDFVDDPAGAEALLKRAIATGGNTLLDALVESTRDLKKREGTRSAVLVVTGNTTNVGNRDQYRSAEEAAKNADLFLAIDFQEGSGEGEAERKYGYALDTLTRQTGGMLERSLTATAVEAVLPKFTNFLLSLYRVSFATLPEVREKTLEVQVARPGVKVRLPPPRPKP